MCPSAQFSLVRLFSARKEDVIIVQNMVPGSTWRDRYGI